MTDLQTIQSYSSARRLKDGRVIVSTRGGSHFALSIDDWREALKDIEYLALDPETEIVINDLPAIRGMGKASDSF